MNRRELFKGMAALVLALNIPIRAPGDWDDWEVGTMTPSLLDDYEEGYMPGRGYYTRVGNVVMWNGTVTIHSTEVGADGIRFFNHTYKAAT